MPGGQGSHAEIFGSCRQLGQFALDSVNLGVRRPTCVKSPNTVMRGHHFIAQQISVPPACLHRRTRLCSSLGEAWDRRFRGNELQRLAILHRIEPGDLLLQPGKLVVCMPHFQQPALDRLSLPIQIRQLLAYQVR